MGSIAMRVKRKYCLLNKRIGLAKCYCLDLKRMHLRFNLALMGDWAHKLGDLGTCTGTGFCCPVPYIAATTRYIGLPGQPSI